MLSIVLSLSYFLQFCQHHIVITNDNGVLSFSGPILCIALNTNGSVCYSGGVDATIQWWNLPPLMLDLFGSYGKIFVILIPYTL